MTFLFRSDIPMMRVPRSAYTPTRTPCSVGDSSGVILILQTLRLSCPASVYMYLRLALFYLSVLHSFLLPQRDRHAHIHTHTDTHTQTHIRRHTPKDTPKDTPNMTRRTHTYTHTVTHTNKTVSYKQIRTEARTPFGRSRGFSEWLREDTFRR